MLIPPKYFLTPKISKLLSQIEANKEVVNSVSIPSEIELNIRRQSTLKSSLFSARIEGNTADLEGFIKLASKDKRKIEINNILRAINWVYEASSRAKIAKKDILALHQTVMKGIDSDVGRFRTEHEGIFTSGGVVVYHAPPPSLIGKMIDKLLKYIETGKEEFIPIKAILAHFVFEKIHPFTDGSGRIGRLLMLMVLENNGYGFKGILPFEERIDKRRETYYKMLEEPERDVTSYLEFMLEVLADSSSEAKEAVLTKHDFKPEDFLLPRRSEIYKIIKEHRFTNFDMIRRRFREVGERSLRFDLKYLVDHKFIKKLGTTKGVYYS